MPSPIQEVIDRIQEQIRKMDIFGFLDEMDAILESKEITKEERVYALITKSELLLFHTYFGLKGATYEKGLKVAKEALKISIEIENKTLIIDSKQALLWLYFYMNAWKEVQQIIDEIITSFDEIEPSQDFYYFKRKAYFLMCKGLVPFIKIYTGNIPVNEEIEEAIKLWQEGEQFCKKHNLPYLQAGFLFNLGSMHATRGELDLALDIRLKSLKIAKENTSKFGVLYYIGPLAWAYFNKNDYKKFFDLMQERLRLAEELGSRKFIAYTYGSMGTYYVATLNYDDAIEYYNRSLEIHRSMKNENSSAFVQNSIGNVYYLKGDLDKAIENYEEAFPVLKENQPQGWFGILSDLAEVSVQKGDLETSLKYLEELMTIQKGFQNKFSISHILTEQGKIFWQKGMKDQSLTLIRDGFELRQKIGNKNLIADSLSYLIQFNVELGNIEAAKKYFVSLDIINKETKIKQVSQNHKFSEAIILKSSSDLRDRLKAEVLFEHLIEEDVSYPVLIQTLMHLCDLLLLEMKETDDSKVLEKINKHITKLQELSEKNNSHILLVQTLRLQAQLALIEFDIDNSRALLLKAQNIAQEHGFERLVLDLLKQQEKLTKQSIELTNLEKTSSTISQRMSVIEINDTVSSIKRTSITETVKKEEEVSKKLFSIQI